MRVLTQVAPMVFLIHLSQHEGSRSGLMVMGVSSEQAPKRVGTLPSDTERRKGSRTRTIPEQIADHLASGIISGDYRAGERIREQEVSTLYGVSRGPVREAIRTLEKRGLVEFFPRRGAYAVDISADLFADFFNVRSALIGMAARCFAVAPSEAGLGELRHRLGEVEAACARKRDDCTFTQRIGAVARAIYGNSGNAPLERILHDQVANSVWGLIWRQDALDFTSVNRRRQAAQEWRDVLTAIEAANPDLAELRARTAMAQSRDQAVAALCAQRGESVSASKMTRFASDPAPGEQRADAVTSKRKPLRRIDRRAS